MAEGTAIGIGPTTALSLRVSAATLVRVEFPHPAHGEPQLALEHKATRLSIEGAQRLIVKAQPFGGAVRFQNLTDFLDIVPFFHFDSERAQRERDVRIFIRPSDWPAVREFCLRNFQAGAALGLETDPSRELVEEFNDALGKNLRSEQYVLEPLRTVVENKPTHTENVHAFGIKTVRVYGIFRAQILDPELGRAMLANSTAHSTQVLEKLAREDAARGGPGRANAIWVIPKEAIYQLYKKLDLASRQGPVAMMNTVLDGNVPAILDGVEAPNYQAAFNP